ncbi:MAG: FAD-dependent oxidoreductase [Cyclobacteriaceae bacterium]|jgi:monoamine oxidase|nr:FAD-dependent oxidoreductase [Cyclobacteriaceae bacterium]
MNRRELLKQLGFGLTAGMVLPSLMVSCAKDDPGPEIQYDGTVAVIGGGAAGLYAADILTAKGVNVVLFEASGQLGGRVRSLRNQRDESGLPITSIADFPVEVGAEIIYGSDSVWNQIVRNLNVAEVDLDVVATDLYRLANEVKAAADWGNDSDFAAVRDFVEGLPNYSGGAVSIEAAAGVTPRAANLLNARAANTFGSTASRIGAKGLGESLAAIEHDQKRILVTRNPMQDVLVSRFAEMAKRARLNTPIVSINYSGARIVLTDGSGNQTEVDKVIVTAPLAVLKAGDIAFTPGLPGTNTAAFSQLGMDACVRVILDFKKNFWGEDTGFIWGGNLVPQYFNAGVTRSQLYRTLTATVYGVKAEQLAALGSTNAIVAILAELDEIYAGQATEFIRRDLNNNQIISFLFNWTQDPYIKGGFSYPLVNGSLESRASLSTPVQGKVFFAGEATDITGNAGTINGALASAERAVEEVVQSILNPI